MGVGESAYQYNGKELNEDLELDWLDYGARWYDAAVGRFTGVDPISDQFPHVSTYNYAENEPIANIDLWGLQAVKPNMQHLGKPGDLFSTKMLINLKEGVKTIAIEVGIVANKARRAVMDNVVNPIGDWIEGKMPVQGSPAAEDFHDSGDSFRGESVDFLSNTELNGNGTTDTPGADKGATSIIETGELILPSDGGGIGGDASSKSTQASRSMYYGSLFIDKISDLNQDNSTGEPVDSTCNSCNKEPHGLPYRRIDSRGIPIDTINPNNY